MKNMKRLFFYPKNQKGCDTTKKSPLPERSPPLPDQHPKPTIKHNIQKGQVHLYGIKIRYSQHGKDIRQLGICRRRQNRTKEESNGRMAVLSRSFNLYSDVQRADDIVVILPAEAGEKTF